MNITKICKLCNISKSITDYYKNKHTGWITKGQIQNLISKIPKYYFIFL